MYAFGHHLREDGLAQSFYRRQWFRKSVVDHIDGLVQYYTGDIAVLQ